MGILQKILLVLQKLDPNSEKWLDRLLADILDPMYQKELKSKIDQPNYLHKLGIIKDSIFGVDIQPISASKTWSTLPMRRKSV
jgi:adenine-specific DNA-methyltransferase